MTSIKPEFLKQLPSLQYLFLSGNHISELVGEPFPSTLIHLDLAYNAEPVAIPDGMKMLPTAFKNLSFLKTLDISYSKIMWSSIAVLNSLPYYLQGLSLCFTGLPEIKGDFLTASSNIKYLDISGNSLLSLNERMFTNLSASLEVLSVRTSSVRKLDWMLPLCNLKKLDLYDNSIHTVSSDSFSHMTSLVKLNLEKNSIGNWYESLFAQNQQLEILNLRENKLTTLTTNMIEDLSTVQLLALGSNDFECSCELEKFMKILFRATKDANITAMRKDKDNEFDESADDESFVDTTRVALGVRNYLRPEYDIIARTYQKYYEMVAQSSEALKIRMSIVPLSQSNRMMMKSSVGRGISDDFQTVLFDYNEDDDDYKCVHATQRKTQPIIDVDLCEDESKDDTPPYKRNKNNTMLALSISLPSVLVISALVIVIYWKWWYIKYFFVLCKNSAILTFMDDSDGDKETIVKGPNNEPVEIYLYDVFVSYSDQNRNWVLDEFIPNVEKRESINVCLHERDFQVGFGILENIVSCMDRSRCLLLLISENFLQSQWCQFEMNLAQHRLLETRREKLIVVLLEDIPAQKQPKTLKYLMRTKTYIKWPQNGSGEDKQLFWKRLKKAIISSKWETESYGSIV